MSNGYQATITCLKTGKGEDLDFSCMSEPATYARLSNLPGNFTEPEQCVTIGDGICAIGKIMGNAWVIL